ncbi:MAG: peptidylprolyl isomerase [Desulfovibrio sp.]|nr:peptidylprolyl isomerase [Desulfovibrio sp.]
MGAKKGDSVFVHYTGKLDDGTVFDSSVNGEPLEFVLGNGMILPKFEAAVAGKEVGDKMSVYIPMAEAYGEHKDDLVIAIPREDVPLHVDPNVGSHYQVTVDRQDMDFIVTRVNDEEIELDANHPLAGKNLAFDIEIVRIRPCPC